MQNIKRKIEEEIDTVYILYVAYVAFLGAMLWKFSLASDMPPIYDGLTYFTKGKNFWESIKAYKIIEAIMAQPGIRPIGTVLMSFPFGYDGSYKSFHFRSAFFPIFFISIASWVVMSQTTLIVRSTLKWSLLVTLSSLPIFFHFEPNPQLVSHVLWGHVDSFLAALAALAVVVHLRAFADQSLKWLTAGAIVSLLCFFVKPAGLLIAISICGLWTVTTLTVLWKQHRAGLDIRTLRLFFLLGLSLELSILLLGCLAAIKLNYITISEINYFKSGLSILANKRTYPFSFHELKSILRPTIGYPVVAIFVIVAMCTLVLIVKKRVKQLGLSARENYDYALVGLIWGVVLLVEGVAWWVITTNGQMLRYVVPFLLMFLVSSLPFTYRAIAESNRVIRFLSISVGLFSALNISVLLLTPSPSVAWQNWSGVNITSGRWNKEVYAANDFVKTLSKNNNGDYIYELGVRAPITAFEASINFQNTTGVMSTPIYFSRPIDWLRPSTYRFSEILSSDYLLLDKVTAKFQTNILRSFSDEDKAIQAWASGLTTNEGVTVITETDSLKMLKITNRSRLNLACARLIDQYKWPKPFIEANEVLWTNYKSMKGFITTRREIADSIEMPEVFKIHAITTNRQSDNLYTSLEIWWELERNAEKTFGDTIMRFKFIDKNGNPLTSGEIRLFPQSSPYADRPIHYDSTTIRTPYPKEAVGLSLSFIGKTGELFTNLFFEQKPMKNPVIISINKRG